MADIATGQTTASLWASACREFGDRPFLVQLDADGGRSEFSYAEFGRLIHRAAHAFSGLGIGVGDTVALQIGNSPEMLAALFGLTEIGGIAVPLGLTATPAELLQAYRASGARWAVVEAARVGDHLDLREQGAVADRRLIAVHGRVDGAESFERFLSQGLTVLGDKLGPINWQFMGTKRFEPEDFEGFLKLLPKEKDGVRLRHALEVRHPSFATAQFYDLARQYGAAIVHAVDDEEPTWPRIDEATTDFTYARLMSSREDEPTGMTSDELDAVAKQARGWADRGEVFAYFISGAKVRNPAAAQALIARLKA